MPQSDVYFANEFIGGARMSKRHLKAVLRSLGLLDFARRPFETLKTSSLNLRMKLFPGNHTVPFAGKEVGFPIYDAHTFHWFVRYRGQNHNGWHEPSLTKFFEDMCHEKRTLLDIGAHLGYFSLLFSSRPENVSYAIELDPVNFEYLEKVAHDTEGVDGTVKTFNIGFGAEKSRKFLKVRSPNTMTSLALAREEPMADEEWKPVEVVTLDQFVADNGISPDIMKMDVEGFEYAVWNGGKATIEKYRPVMAIEIHTPVLKKQAVDIDGFFSEIRNLGYRIFSFPEHRSKSPKDLVEIEGPLKLDNYDIVCLPTVPADSASRANEPAAAR